VELQRENSTDLTGEEHGAIEVAQAALDTER
jgi:hypothetical protein